jgi:diguanylate cyclase (GGDEF)-like protein
MFDADRGVVDADQGWQDATGQSLESTLGEGWLNALAPGSRAPALAQLERSAAGGRTGAAEWEVEDGGYARIVDAVAQTIGGGHEAPGRCIVAIVDVTGQCLREHQLVHDATHDDLSGLLNRAAMERTADHALARLGRTPSTVGLMYVDLDEFKSVNDRFGHGIGDLVLAAASQRLLLVLRPSDTVARVGGDEFVILCEDLERAADAVSVGHRVVDVLARPFDVGGDRVELGASVGIALTRSGTTATSTLMRAADRAMYEAKRLGRGRVVVDDATGAGNPGSGAPLHPDGDQHPLPLAARAEVRDRYCGEWAAGFDVVTRSHSGYQMRRTADGYVLPGVFATDVVRPQR